MTIVAERDATVSPALDSPELLIKEARRATRRRRLRIGVVAAVVVLVAVVASLSSQGGTPGPVHHRALRPMRSPGLTTELAQQARSACAKDSNFTYPLPYRVVQLGTVVHAFFSSWTSDGVAELGPVNCQYVMGTGPRTGSFGFSTSPDEQTPGLSAMRPMVASMASLGEAFHNPTTISTLLDGEVGPSVKKVILWADVPSSSSFTSLPELQIVEVIHTNRQSTGGYLAAVLPNLARASQVPDQVYLVAYGQRDRYLGEDSCVVSQSGMPGVDLGASCLFSATQFLGAPRNPR